MSTTAFDQSPGQGYSSVAVGDGHHLQLMREAYFAVINGQTDLCVCQSLVDGCGDGFIPVSDTDGRIIQKTHYSPGQA